MQLSLFLSGYSDEAEIAKNASLAFEGAKRRIGCGLKVAKKEEETVARMKTASDRQ